MVSWWFETLSSPLWRHRNELLENFGLVRTMIEPMTLYTITASVFHTLACGHTDYATVSWAKIKVQTTHPMVWRQSQLWCFGVMKGCVPGCWHDIFVMLLWVWWQQDTMKQAKIWLRTGIVPMDYPSHGDSNHLASLAIHQWYSDYATKLKWVPVRRTHSLGKPSTNGSDVTNTFIVVERLQSGQDPLSLCSVSLLFWYHNRWNKIYRMHSCTLIKPCLSRFICQLLALQETTCHV